jgi:hypothetical protein
VQNGNWQSTQTSFGPAPIITFVVRGCAVVSLEIFIFAYKDELDIVSEAGLSLPITDNQWTYTHVSGAGQLIVSGTFNSPITAVG